MKKLLYVNIFLLLVIIALVIVIIYKPCKNTVCCDGKPQGQTKGYCGDTLCYKNDGSNLVDLIDIEFAKRMSADYAADPGKGFIWTHDGPTTQQDTRSIWFDLMKFKNYIGYIERFACNNGCSDSAQFGIRFYYARYPGTADSLDRMHVPLSYANHHTLFMVPTYRYGVNGTNMDFDISRKATGCKPIPVDSLGSKVIIPWHFFDNLTDDPNVENHGGLRPPPDNTGSFLQ
jgi:hypothetical protein